MASKNAAKDQPLYVTNPEEWLAETVQGPDLVCIVIFRGSWCKYDRHYLRKLGHHHVTTMKQERVTLIAWTSEGAAGAKKADEQWGLTKNFGYDLVIGDETNALANWLKEDEILPDLAIVSVDDANLMDTIPDKEAYPNGIVMPGQVWYAHHGTLVFQWTSKCEQATGFGGASGRPDPIFVWEEIVKRKHALDHGSAIMPVHDTSGMKLCSRELEVNLSSCDIL